nr:nudix hydrolase 9 isoform X3 [Malus domestica]
MEKAEIETITKPYRLLLACPSGLSPSQISVVFDGVYDRIPHPDINLENSISEIWDQRVQKNPSLYNGTKFRYGQHVWNGGGGSNQEPHVCLNLGLTDYRTFVGTNLNPLWERFLVRSEDDAIRCQHTSSPLGNGAIVETSDKKILVLQRSNNVGEFPGHFVFPGGHPEPHEVGIISHHHKDVTDSKAINNKVSQEMFESIVREVVEEIGVPSASLIELENMASKMPACHEGGFTLYKMMVEAVKNV